jgi:hypothetical protein
VSKDVSGHMLVNLTEIREIAKQRQLEFNENAQSSQEFDQKVPLDGEDPKSK